MEIKDQIDSDVVILKLTGTLQSENDAMLLRERMYAYVEKKHIHVVLDLSDLRYINSWGLGLLVAVLSMIRKAGGDLRLACLGDHVQNLFIVSQLSKVFRSYEKVDEAVRSFR